MPSHRTPRPARGAPLYLNQPQRRIPPTGQQHVNQLGRPPAPTPPHPSRAEAPAPVVAPDTIAVENRDVPVQVIADWAAYEALRGSWNDEDEEYRPPTLEAGDCYFGSYQGVDEKDLRCLWLTLPTADGGVSTACIDIVPPGGNPPLKEHPRWNWNGSIERPSLTPSIRHANIESGRYWHGHLVDGVLVGCKGERKPNK